MEHTQTTDLLRAAGVSGQTRRARGEGGGNITPPPPPCYLRDEAL